MPPKAKGQEPTRNASSSSLTKGQTTRGNVKPASRSNSSTKLKTVQRPPSRAGSPLPPVEDSSPPIEYKVSGGGGGYAAGGGAGRAGMTFASPALASPTAAAGLKFGAAPSSPNAHAAGLKFGKSSATPAAAAASHPHHREEETKSEDAIKVFVRVRPENAMEKGKERCIELEGADVIRCSFKSESGATKTFPFKFDRVFDVNATQDQVFEQVSMAIMGDFFKGFNATVFAYGQTGSGKTWSMMGDRNHKLNRGLTPRLIQMVFDHIDSTYAKNPQAKQEIVFQVELGYIEIYMECIQDLLDIDKKNLQIREARGRGIWIDQQTRASVSSLSRVMDLIDIGDTNRTVASTEMNASSSRSHAVVDIELTQLDRKSGAKITSSLYLVDLAGSEKQTKTKAEGERLKQGIAINKSLSALGNVIKALSDKSKFVPYRDSKLTRLLTNALGGNSKTLVITAVSPSSFNAEETLETLRFGKRAKSIETKAVQNKEFTIADYKRIVNTLKDEVNTLSEENKALRAVFQQSKAPASVLAKAPLGVMGTGSYNFSNALADSPLSEEGALSPASLNRVLPGGGGDESKDLGKAVSKAEAIKVFCRVRPENKMEAGYERCVQFQGKDTIVACLKEGEMKKELPFVFDRVFDPTSTQEQVFQEVKTAIMTDFFKGFNATIFAYGQTGSGKTWSMMGQRDDPTHRGLTPRLIQAVFDHINTMVSSNSEAKKHMYFKVELGYLEIYMEHIQDLLEMKNSNLAIREARGRGIWVDNQTRATVANLQEVLALMDKGDANRTVAATMMNSTSSRSHAVFDLQLTQLDKKSGAKVTSSLFLVDLAGSEKQKKTGASGELLDQGIAINKSLSALGNVIKALSDKSKFVPYRDSKLTRLLTNALGGNSKTLVITACSPSHFNADETVETLRFGKRAKTIKTKMVQNREYSISDYKRMVNGLRTQITLLNDDNEVLRKINETNLKMPLSSPTKTSGPAQLGLPAGFTGARRKSLTFEEVVAQTPVGSHGQISSAFPADVGTDHFESRGKSEDDRFRSDGFDKHETVELTETDSASSSDEKSDANDLTSWSKDEEEIRLPSSGSIAMGRRNLFGLSMGTHKMEPLSPDPYPDDEPSESERAAAAVDKLIKFEQKEAAVVVGGGKGEWVLELDEEVESKSEDKEEDKHKEKEKEKDAAAAKQRTSSQQGETKAKAKAKASSVEAAAPAAESSSQKQTSRRLETEQWVLELEDEKDDLATPPPDQNPQVFKSKEVAGTLPSMPEQPEEKAAETEVSSEPQEEEAQAEAEEEDRGDKGEEEEVGGAAQGEEEEEGAAAKAQEQEAEAEEEPQQEQEQEAEEEEAEPQPEQQEQEAEAEAEEEAEQQQQEQDKGREHSMDTSKQSLSGRVLEKEPDSLDASKQSLDASKQSLAGRLEKLLAKSPEQVVKSPSMEEEADEPDARNGSGGGLVHHKRAKVGHRRRPSSKYGFAGKRIVEVSEETGQPILEDSELALDQQDKTGAKPGLSALQPSTSPLSPTTTASSFDDSVSSPAPADVPEETAQDELLLRIESTLDVLWRDLEWKGPESSYVKSSLKAPVFVDKKFKRDALSCFSSIKEYMRGKRKDLYMFAQEFLRSVLHSAPTIWDEVYAQLIMQTTECPDKAKCVRGWELMIFCLATFPPQQQKMRAFMPHHFKQAQSGVADADVKRLAKVGESRLALSIKLGPRQQPPTKKELEEIKTGKPSVVRIDVIDGTYKMFMVDSWTTAEDAMDMMAKKYQIDPELAEEFQLFEVSDMGSKRIEYNVRVLDCSYVGDRGQVKKLMYKAPMHGGRTPDRRRSAERTPKKRGQGTPRSTARPVRTDSTPSLLDVINRSSHSLSLTLPSGSESARCAECGNLEPKYSCEGCKSADYCSEECQVKHWKKEHRLSCKEKAAEYAARHTGRARSASRISPSHSLSGSRSESHNLSRRNSHSQTERSRLDTSAGHQLLQAQADLDGFASTGVWIQEVTPGTPSFEAGIQAGDFLTHVDGVEVSNFIQVSNLLATSPEHWLVVRRGDQTLELHFVIPDPNASVGGELNEKFAQRYTKTIKQAVLEQNRHLDNEAVKLFRNIQAYMEARVKDPLQHSCDFLGWLLESPANLWDEAYAQLCMQTTHCPKTTKAVRGWELLIYCLATFPPPSRQVRAYLPHYFRKTCQRVADKDIVRLAQDCDARLDTALKLGPRAQPPTKKELEAVRASKPSVITVETIDQTYKMFKVDSWTTAEDVTALMAQKLHLNYADEIRRGHFLALYEVVDQVPHLIEPRSRILDIA
eukprot:g52421.t1